MVPIPIPRLVCHWVPTSWEPVVAVAGAAAVAEDEAAAAAAAVRLQAAARTASESAAPTGPERVAAARH